MSSESIGARWEGLAEEALKRQGYTVIDRAGINDYQGWCSLLGRTDIVGTGITYAVVSWSYGSCSGCDSREDQEYEQVILDFIHDTERFADEGAAWACFDGRKGW